MAELKHVGVKRIVMLTGDKQEVAADVAKTVGIDEYHAELLPTDKVDAVERLLQEKGSGTMAFVGDGINDAPVLARADVGIAMGGLGSDAAIEGCRRGAHGRQTLEDCRRHSSGASHALFIAKENTWFAILVKVAVLLLAFFGLATMWMAVFADVGVTVLAVINATRTLRGDEAVLPLLITN